MSERSSPSGTVLDKERTDEDPRGSKAPGHAAPGRAWVEALPPTEAPEDDIVDAVIVGENEAPDKEGTKDKQGQRSEPSGRRRGKGKGGDHARGGRGQGGRGSGGNNGGNGGGSQGGGKSGKGKKSGRRGPNTAEHRLAVEAACTALNEARENYAYYVRMNEVQFRMSREDKAAMEEAAQVWFERRAEFKAAQEAQLKQERSGAELEAQLSQLNLGLYEQDLEAVASVDLGWKDRIRKVLQVYSDQNVLVKGIITFGAGAAIGAFGAFVGGGVLAAGLAFAAKRGLRVGSDSLFGAGGKKQRDERKMERVKRDAENSATATLEDHNKRTDSDRRELKKRAGTTALTAVVTGGVGYLAGDAISGWVNDRASQAWHATPWGGHANGWGGEGRGSDTVRKAMEVRGGKPGESAAEWKASVYDKLPAAEKARVDAFFSMNPQQMEFMGSISGDAVKENQFAKMVAVGEQYQAAHGRALSPTELNRALSFSQYLQGGSTPESVIRSLTAIGAEDPAAPNILGRFDVLKDARGGVGGAVESLNSDYGAEATSKALGLGIEHGYYTDSGIIEEIKSTLKGSAFEQGSDGLHPLVGVAAAAGVGAVGYAGYKRIRRRTGRSTESSDGGDDAERRESRRGRRRRGRSSTEGNDGTAERRESRRDRRRRGRSNGDGADTPRRREKVKEKAKEKFEKFKEGFTEAKDKAKARAKQEVEDIKSTVQTTRRAPNDESVAQPEQQPPQERPRRRPPSPPPQKP